MFHNVTQRHYIIIRMALGFGSGACVCVFGCGRFFGFVLFSINSLFIYLHSFLVLFMCFQNFLICSYPFFVRLLNRIVLFFLFVLCLCLCFWCVCIIYVRYAKSFDFHFILLRYVHSYGRRLLFTVGALRMRLVEFCTCKTHTFHEMVCIVRGRYFSLSFFLTLLRIPLMETSRARLPRFLFRLAWDFA